MELSSSRTLNLLNSNELLSLTISVSFTKKPKETAVFWIGAYNNQDKMTSKFNLSYNPAKGNFKSKRASVFPYNFSSDSEFTLRLYDKLVPPYTPLASGKFRINQILVSKDLEYNGNLEQDIDIIAKFGIKMLPKETEEELNYIIDVKAEDVKDIEFFSKSDPFLVIYRSKFTPVDQPDIIKNPEEIEWWVPVIRTEFYKDNLNPDFKPFEISSNKLCKDDPSTPLKLEIWDYSKKGKHTLISKGYFTLNELLQGREEIKTYDKNLDLSGTILIQSIKTNKSKRFIDIILNGDLHIKPYIFIDFDKRNLVKKQNLHSTICEALNIYEKCFQKIYTLISDFFYKKKCEGYGFGVNPKKDYQDTYLVPLNMDYGHPEIIGIGSFLANYRSFLEQNKPNFTGDYMRQFVASLHSKIFQKIMKDGYKGYHLLIFLSPLDEMFNEESGLIKQFAVGKKIFILVIRITVRLLRSDLRYYRKSENFAEIHIGVDHEGEIEAGFSKAFSQFREFIEGLNQEIGRAHV